MIKSLIGIIMGIFVAIESATEQQVDPEWAIDTLERMFSHLRSLEETDLRVVREIAQKIAVDNQAQDGLSKETQLIMSFCDQIDGENDLI